jgi:hypothetical protein
VVAGAVGVLAVAVDVAVVDVAVTGGATVAMIRERTRAIPVRSAVRSVELSCPPSRLTSALTCDRLARAPARSPRPASDMTAANWERSAPAVDGLNPELWAEPQPARRTAARQVVARQTWVRRIPGPMMLIWTAP